MLMQAHQDERLPRGSKRLVSRIRQIVVEYHERGLGAAGAWAEVLAAIREMDRRNQERRR